MNQFIKIVILCVVFQKASAQKSEVRTLKGKVISEAIELDGIYIVNINTDAESATEKEGFFSIKAAVGDTLMFSAIQFEGKKVVVTERDFGDNLLMVKLEPMINRLDEVIIRQYKDINAVSLGIISPNTKHYTKAERKLGAGSGVQFSENRDGTTGGSFGLDPLFNWMSGRTSILFKELEVERKETLLQKLENQFSLDYFIKKLKIPEDYVKGFWYYAVEDAKFRAAMNAKNRTMATFILTELATKYVDLLKSDDK